MANVIVVDDAKVMRLSIIRQLEKLGHSIVSEASNGYEAVEEYKKHKSDFVTMDISMPNVNGITNGIDALVKIKEFDTSANVIMVTSHGEEKLVIDAISKGSKGYILKPITQDKLSSILKKISF